MLVKKDLYSKNLRRLAISDFINHLAIIGDNKTIINKDDSFTQVIKITGCNFAGLTVKEAEALYADRVNAFSTPSEDIFLQVWLDRKEAEEEIYDIQFPTEILKEFHDIEHSEEDSNFITELYITITLKTKIRVKDEIEYFVIQRQNLDRLNLEVDKFSSHLEKYNPIVLTSDSKRHENLKSFLSKRFNFTKKTTPPNTNNDLPDLMALTSVKTNEETGLIEFIYDTEKTYGYLLRLNCLPDETYQEILDTLSSIRANFSIWQNLRYMNDKSFLEKLVKHGNTLGSLITSDMLKFFNLGTIYGKNVAEISNAQTLLSNDETRFVKYSFNILVYAEDMKTLNSDLKKIQIAMRSNNVEVVRETDNIDNAFFSQMIGLEKNNSFREKNVDIHNVVNFSSLSAHSEGHKRCTWGNHPVCQIETTANTVFNFTFHQDEAYMAPGSTVVIGPSGSGKTTFMAWLIKNCMSYGNNKNFGGRFKALIFDAGAGLHPQVKALGGSYINLSSPNNLPLNPLFLAKDSNDFEHVNFLINWVCVLAGGDLRDDEKTAIDRAVKELLDSVDRKDRRLEDLRPMLTSLTYKEDEATLLSKLEKWFYNPDLGNNNTMHSQYFNANKDALNFEEQLVAFDMDNLLKNDDDILIPMMMYITHSYHHSIKESPCPNMIYVDEAHTYLKTKIGSDYFNDTILKIRKSGGIVAMASQTVGHFLKCENGASILQNIVTKIVFPNSDANEEELIELGLNTSDVDWVIKNGKRFQVLIKKTGMQSIFGNINFKKFGKFIHLLTGSFEDIALIESLLKKHSFIKAVRLYMDAKDNREKAKEIAK